MVGVLNLAMKIKLSVASLIILLAMVVSIEPLHAIFGVLLVAALLLGFDYVAACLSVRPFRAQRAGRALTLLAWLKLSKFVAVLLAGAVVFHGIGVTALTWFLVGLIAFSLSVLTVPWFALVADTNHG